MSERPLAAKQRACTAITVLAASAAIGVGLWVLGGIIDVLLLCFAGLLLGLLLRGMGSWFARRTGGSVNAMVGAACVISIGLSVLTIWVASPAIAAQADDLASALPRAFDEASAPLQQFSWGRALLDRVHHPSGLIPERGMWSRAGGAVSMALGGLGGALVVVFIGLFTAFDPGPYVRGLLRLIPLRRRALVDDCLSLVAHTLRMWMVGKLVSMVVVGIATWAGLQLLGVPLAPIMALLAAALTFVPNFGPIASAVPALLLALLQGPMKALWVAGLYIGVQTIESYVLTPLMQKKMISLPPALTLIAQVLMGTLAGGLGLLVATPLTATLLVVVKKVYVEEPARRLNRNSE